MSGTEDLKNAWVRRALKVALPAQSGNWPQPKMLTAIFLDAKGTVDAQVSQLQVAFRNVAHPVGTEVADRGLIGLNRSMFVPLQTALRDYAGAAPARRGDFGPKLRAAIDNVAAFIAGDKVLPFLEGNPFGVTVTIRATYTTALRQMQAALKGAAHG